MPCTRIAAIVAVAAFALVARPSPVRADAKADVETAIRGAIDGKKEYGGDAPRPWTGLYILDATGLEGHPEYYPYNLLTSVRSGSDPKQDWTAIIADVEWKLGPLAIGVDPKHGVAWFQAAVSLQIDSVIVGINCCDITADAMRMSGIVVQEGKAWKLVAIALSRQLSDAQLFKGAKDNIETSIDVDDANPLEKQIIATWFAKGGLAKSHVTAPSVVASGTAPAEYATNEAAVKLAAAWDAIDLRTRAIESKTFANNAIALVHVDMQLPVKRANKAAPMDLYAIAIPEGKTWHWVSLQFTTALATPPKSPREHVNEPGSPPIPPGVQP